MPPADGCSVPVVPPSKPPSTTFFFSSPLPSGLPNHPYFLPAFLPSFLDTTVTVFSSTTTKPCGRPFLTCWLADWLTYWLTYLPLLPRHPCPDLPCCCSCYCYCYPTPLFFHCPSLTLRPDTSTCTASPEVMWYPFAVYALFLAGSRTLHWTYLLLLLLGAPLRLHRQNTLAPLYYTTAQT